MTRVSRLWDYIYTWGLCKDIKDIQGIGIDNDEDNEEDNNNDKGSSALGLDRDLGF